MKDHSPQKLLLILCLICGASGLMQVLVFNKKQHLHQRHYRDPRRSPSPDLFVPSGPPLDGTVAAVGMDRIHLRNQPNGAVVTFRCDEPAQYKVGQKLRVTYAQGNPPQALKIEIVSQ